MSQIEVCIRGLWRRAWITHQAAVLARRNKGWWTFPSYPVQLVTPYGWASIRVVASQIRPVAR